MICKIMDKLIVFKKTYDFLIWLYPCLDKFPKSQKFVLGNRIMENVLDFLEILIETNNAYEKKDLLKKASIKLDEIRVLFRLAKDLRLINLKRYQVACEKINELGRILGGLRKRFG